MNLKVRLIIQIFVNFIIIAQVGYLQETSLPYVLYLVYLILYLRLLLFPVYKHYLDQTDSPSSISLLIYSGYVTYVPIISFLHAVRIIGLSRYNFKGIIKEGLFFTVISVAISSSLFMYLKRDGRLLGDIDRIAPVYFMSGEIVRNHYEMSRQMEVVEMLFDIAIERCDKPDANFDKCITEQSINIIKDAKINYYGLHTLYRRLALALTNQIIPILQKYPDNKEKLKEKLKMDASTLLAVHMDTCTLPEFNDNNIWILNIASGAIAEKLLVQAKLNGAKSSVNPSIRRWYYYFLSNFNTKIDLAEMIEYFNTFPMFNYCLR